MCETGGGGGGGALLKIHFIFGRRKRSINNIAFFSEKLQSSSQVRVKMKVGRGSEKLVSHYS